jgi:ATP-binding cassette, subfamily C (CFTR/MRP), member 1
MMASKDSRVKIMNETLQGIRLIKFFAWEASFQGKISDIRDEELAALRSSAYLRAIMTFLWMSTPLLVSMVTFIVYTVAGYELTPEKAFTALALFNILRFPLNMLPSVISGMVEASISLKRLDVCSKHLLVHCKPSDLIACLIVIDSSGLIHGNHRTICWPMS